MQVKSPDKSIEPWDYYNVDRPFKGDQVWTTKAEAQVRAVEVSGKRRRRPRPPPWSFSASQCQALPRAAAARAGQRLVLRHPQPRAGRDLRPAGHHQLRPRRALHDGGVLASGPAQTFGPQLLGALIARRWWSGHFRGGGRAPALRWLYKLDPLRPAAHLRHRADHRGASSATSTASSGLAYDPVPGGCCRAASISASCSCPTTAAGGVFASLWCASAPGS